MPTAFRLFTHSKLLSLKSAHRLQYFQYIHPRKFLSTHNHGRPGLSNVERERTKKLLFGLKNFLGNVRDHKLVDGFVHKKLDQHLPQTTAPHLLYGKVISLLINNGSLSEATSVYERMISDGFVPSTEIEAQMLAVALALSDSDVEITQAFDTVITDPGYSEDRFVRLLRIMVSLGISHKRLLQIVERFVDTRQEGYSPGQMLVTKMVDAQVRAGLLEDAFETILRYDASSSGQTSTDPYVAVITALKDTQPLDDQSLKDTLELMKRNGVEPDIAVFNALISRALRERSLYKAFSLYTALTQLSKSMQVSPDGFTFGSLFSILTKLYKSHQRSARFRQYKSPNNAIPPRQLYRDMISARSRSSLQITSSLLNTALRAFISKHDYAGAFIVVRSFSVFSLDITAKTYFIMMRHVMNRLRWDIKGSRKPGDSRWGDRFLGITTASHAELADLEIDEGLAEAVLSFARRSVFDLFGNMCEGSSTATTEPPGSRTYTTPTLSMIDGDSPVPDAVRLSLVPLERILRRAILAEIGSVGTNRPTAKDVSKIIADAKKEMLPNSKTFS